MFTRVIVRVFPAPGWDLRQLNALVQASRPISCLTTTEDTSMSPRHQDRCHLVSWITAASTQSIVSVPASLGDWLEIQILASAALHRPHESGCEEVVCPPGDSGALPFLRTTDSGFLSLLKSVCHVYWPKLSIKPRFSSI